MATYSELMAQAQALMNQAEQARKNELATTIADIKAKMKQYGITVADLGGAASSTKKPAKSKSRPQARVGAHGAGFGQEHRGLPHLRAKSPMHKGHLRVLFCWVSRR